jgi:hypothetical protein
VRRCGRPAAPAAVAGVVGMKDYSSSLRGLLARLEQEGSFTVDADYREDIIASANTIANERGEGEAMTWLTEYAHGIRYLQIEYEQDLHKADMEFRLQDARDALQRVQKAVRHIGELAEIRAYLASERIALQQRVGPAVAGLGADKQFLERYALFCLSPGELRVPASIVNRLTPEQIDRVYAMVKPFRVKSWKRIRLARGYALECDLPYEIDAFDYKLGAEIVTDWIFPYEHHGVPVLEMKQFLSSLSKLGIKEQPATNPSYRLIDGGGARIILNPAEKELVTYYKTA